MTERIKIMTANAESLVASGNYKAAAAAYEAIATEAAQEGLPFPYDAVIEAARNYGEYGKAQAKEGNFLAALEAIVRSKDLMNQVIDSNVPEELRRVAYDGKAVLEDAIGNLQKAVLGDDTTDNPNNPDNLAKKQGSVFPWLIVLGVALFLMRSK